MVDLYGGFGHEEIQLLAEVKRLTERCQGDPAFRKKLAEDPDSRSGMLRSLGIHIDPADLEPLLSSGPVDVHAELDVAAIRSRPTFRLVASRRQRCSQQIRDLVKDWDQACEGRFKEWRSR